jgi:hypothetical protein
VVTAFAESLSNKLVQLEAEAFQKKMREAKLVKGTGTTRDQDVQTVVSSSLPSQLKLRECQLARAKVRIRIT